MNGNIRIKCVKCGKEQESDEYFLRFLPKGVSRPIYVCESCENELGGKSATITWVLETVEKNKTKPGD